MFQSVMTVTMERAAASSVLSVTMGAPAIRSWVCVYVPQGIWAVLVMIVSTCWLFY